MSAKSMARVLIMGLGSKDGGVGAAEFYAHRGAEVAITDLADANALKKSLDELRRYPIRYRLGEHRLEDFLETDLVVRNVGIRPDHPLLVRARSAGAKVRAPIGVFAQHAGRLDVGITGTKGKSFTTELTTHLLGGPEHNVVAAGNCCVSPLRFVGKDDARVVLELSSWQLAELGTLEISPRVACFTNFFTDHQDYYEGLETYLEDKLQITRHQKEGDVFVAPFEDAFSQAIETKARPVYFGLGAPAAHMPDVCYEHEGRVWLRQGGHDEALCSSADLPPAFRFAHLRRLMLAAIATSIHAGAASDALTERLMHFTGLPHRMEVCAPVGNVRFINDSAATTPESAICALDAVGEEPTVLIAGGGGAKKRCFRAMADHVRQKSIGVVLFEEDEVGRQLSEYLPASFAKSTCAPRDMDAAVQAAYSMLPGAGTVLLSSGCKGGPTFADMYDRGRRFRTAARSLA